MIQIEGRRVIRSMQSDEDVNNQEARKGLGVSPLLHFFPSPPTIKWKWTYKNFHKVLVGGSPRHGTRVLRFACLEGARESLVERKTLAIDTFALHLDFHASSAKYCPTSLRLFSR